MTSPHPFRKVQIPPEEVHRSESFLTQQLLDSVCGHWHQHAFERHPLPVDLAIRISALEFDVEEESDKCVIDLDRSTKHFLHEDEITSRSQGLIHATHDLLAVFDGRELQGEHRENNAGVHKGEITEQVLSLTPRPRTKDR